MTGDPLKRLKEEIESADTAVDKSLRMVEYLCKSTPQCLFSQSARLNATISVQEKLPGDRAEDRPYE
jgi:N-glycosylase/DNA lyase